MTNIWCEKSAFFVSEILNERIFMSFYRLASFEIYVECQMWNFWETDKFLSFLVYLNQKWQKIRYIWIYIFTYVKYVYLGQFEVAQLQKKFFLQNVWSSCFQSGIVVTSYVLPKNEILDHFYEEKCHFWQKSAKKG